jgi:hypothetical protein
MATYKKNFLFFILEFIWELFKFLLSITGTLIFLTLTAFFAGALMLRDFLIRKLMNIKKPS